MEEEIRHQIRARLPRVANQIELFLRYGISMKTAKANATEIPLGSSRIGGLPDLPLNQSWPSWKGKPLGFIAQINLEDIAGLLVDAALPETGILFFFYEADEQPWGFDPSDRGCAQVLYCQADISNLTRRAFPEDLSPYSRFDPCTVQFRKVLTLPPLYSKEIEALSFTRGPDRYKLVQIEGSSVYRIEEVLAPEPEDPTEADIYEEIYEVLSEECSPVCHRILGYPDPIQGEMQMEVQLASNGVYTGDPDAYDSEEARKLRVGAKDWRLLLQIDLDGNAGTEWGDVGRIYYWIRQQDMEARDFDKVWLILQCS